MKQCRKCKKRQDESGFHKKTSNKDGFDNLCKNCASTYHKDHYKNNIGSERRKRRERDEWYRENEPDRVKNWKLKSRYGITLEKRDEMVINQDGKCAICGLVLTRKQICVDHDHVTGKVRDILCQGCNKGLGCFLDDQEILIKARNYLLKWVV